MGVSSHENIRSPQLQRGFSLLEMSIVLVAITLVITGIFVAADLMRAVKVRSVTADLEGYRASVYVFSQKYKALPGDFSQAQRYWPSCVDVADNTCNGDGDGIVASGETEGLRAWQHLSLAGMLKYSYTGVLDTGELAYYTPAPWENLFISDAYAGQPKVTICHKPDTINNTLNVAAPSVSAHQGHGDTLGPCAGDTPPAQTGKYTIGVNIPGSKLKAGGFSIGWTGAPPYGLGGNVITFASENAEMLNGSIVNPEEAWSLDRKMDDGLPDRGLVSVADGEGDAGCIAVGATVEYADNEEDILCQIHYWID